MKIVENCDQTNNVKRIAFEETGVLASSTCGLLELLKRKSETLLSLVKWTTGPIILQESAVNMIFIKCSVESKQFHSISMTFDAALVFCFFLCNSFF